MFPIFKSPSLTRIALTTSLIAVGSQAATAQAQIPPVKRPQVFTATNVQTTTLPMTRVASVFKALFQGTDLLLNNYRRGTGGGCIDQKSYFHLGPALDGQQAVMRFDIPPVSAGVGWGGNVAAETAEYYVYKVRLESIDAHAPPADALPQHQVILVRMKFEENEPEIKTFLPGCNADALVPDVEYTSAMYLSFKPTLYGNGELSFDITGTSGWSNSAEPDTFAGNVNTLLGADLYNNEDVMSKALKPASKIVRGRLARPDVKQRIAAAIRQQVLDPAGIGKIMEIETTGGNLIIKHVANVLTSLGTRK